MLLGVIWVCFGFDLIVVFDLVFICSGVLRYRELVLTLGLCCYCVLLTLGVQFYDFWWF